MMNTWSAFRRSMIFCAAALALCAGSAAGSGVAVMEQSVRQLGSGFAGGAAAADDASSIFFNPAGLTRLPGSQLVLGGSILLTNARFRNEGSSDLVGQPLTGGNGGNAGGTMLVPTLYYQQKLSDQVRLGLGIFSPFGLSTNYDPSWVGRYHAVTSELKTLNINPSVAWRISDRFSVGGGLNAQYLNAELSNAIDFGAIFAALGVPGMRPQGNDGFVTLKGDSWSWGYNVGALYEFSDFVRAGIAYRSRIDHTLSGEAHFSGAPSPNPAGRFVDTGIRSDVTLPDSVSVSLWYGLTPELAVMGDMTWTHWSTVEELRIKFDNPAESDAVTTLAWEDTFRWSVGTAYNLHEWSLRGGFAYEQSPVPDARRRTPRVPDNDRIWITAGLGCKITDALSIDTGYAHVFVEDAEIRKTAVDEDRLRGALSGSYRSSVDIATIGVSWSF